MAEEFTDKAGRLLDRINSITVHDKTEKVPDLQFTSLYKTEPKRAIYSRNLNVAAVSPQAQTAIDLAKIEQVLAENEEDNCRKLKNLQEGIKKLENYIKEQNETRAKINQTFVHSLIKVEKNMSATLANIRKLYSEREKKLESRIELSLKQQKKKILQQISANSSLQQQINGLKDTIYEYNAELTQMKRSRLELEDKITSQFNSQIADLKAIFGNAIRVREEREMCILEMLKSAYKAHMDAVRKEEADRENSEKMFLAVIEQLIDRITEA